MISRFPLFFSLCFLFVIPAFVSFAQGPAVLNDTDLGKSQNTSRDLANSLVPGKPNLTKGEKKSEVDPKTLTSKTAKDPLFQGGLNDVGLDWNGDKLGKPKSTTSSETDSKQAAKNEHVAGDQAQNSSTQKEPKSAKEAEGSQYQDSKHVKSEKPAADKQQTPAGTDEKAKEKGSKSDADH